MLDIFLVTRNDEIGYDEAKEFAIVAQDEAKARQTASKQAGDEGAATWFDTERVTCMKVGVSVDELWEDGVVLVRSFNAG